MFLTVYTRNANQNYPVEIATNIYAQYICTIYMHNALVIRRLLKSDQMSTAIHKCYMEYVIYTTVLGLHLLIRTRYKS